MATLEDSDAAVVQAEMDGVFPEGFYATTNFPTDVRVGGQWLSVGAIEMDVGVRIVEREARSEPKTSGVSGAEPPTARIGASGTGSDPSAEGCPMHRVKKGDRIVVGEGGVRVHVKPKGEGEAEAFRFMSSGVSTERPKARMIADVALAMRSARAAKKRILFVGGPAIVHSGSGPALAELVTKGWIDVLFAGNALAAHDIESNLYGTSLGIDLAGGAGVPHGHQHHLRAINRVRRAGSIAEAVRQGLITGGVMHACVTKPIPFVLAGSIRDDGPLPDVHTDVVAAADAMREQARGVGVAIIVATTLHGVATGNMLAADVATFCVDTSADTVIKLVDRGTHQAVGIVTDCEYFLSELGRAL